MFRAHRKYSSGGTQRAGLRDITNTAGNAVKPVSKKASSSAFFRPLPNKQHRSDIAKGATAQRSASSSRRAPRASTKPVIDEIDRADVNDPQVKSHPGPHLSSVLLLVLQMINTPAP